MKHFGRMTLLVTTCVVMLGLTASSPASAQQKPNIVVIMGDDIGMWNIGAYHRGLMAGKTPNLDKLAKEGMLFTDYYAEASCTAGRANFITGELPIRTGMTTVGQAGAKIGIPGRSGDHCHGAEVHGLRHRPIRKESPRTTATSSCPAFTDSTNSSVICITSTPWKIQRIPIIRRIC